jgi:phenylalanyl-tRNA synthetase beta chain
VLDSGIAGIKGGKAAEITEATTDIIIESAHFDGTRVRRASQALKLFTDASLRYQNKPSPELTAYGMRDVLALITDIAGGTIVGVTDVYAPGEAPAPVSVSRTKINNVLGSSLSLSQIEDALTRLAFTYTLTDETVTVEPPFERKDIAIPEDLIEEVLRAVSDG